MDFITTLRISVLSLSFCLCIFQCIALFLLFKCRKLPFKIKWISISFVASGVVSSVSFLVSMTEIQFFDTKYTLLHLIRASLVRSCYVIMWATLAHLAADCMIAIAIPHRYATILTSKVVKTWIILDWVVPCFGGGIPLFYIILFAPDSCDVEMHYIDCLKPVSTTLLVLISVYSAGFILFNALTILYLNRNTEKFTKNLERLNRILKFRRMLIKKTSVYFVLQTPFTIHEIFEHFAPGILDSQLRSGILFFAFLCRCLSILIFARFCVWKLKECRRKFKSMFLFLKKRPTTIFFVSTS